MTSLLFRLEANDLRDFTPIIRAAVLARSLERCGHSVRFASRTRIDCTPSIFPMRRFTPLESEQDFLILADDLTPDAIFCDMNAYDPETCHMLPAHCPFYVIGEGLEQSLPFNLTNHFIPLREDNTENLEALLLHLENCHRFTKRRQTALPMDNLAVPCLVAASDTENTEGNLATIASYAARHKVPAYNRAA